MPPLVCSMRGHMVLSKRSLGWGDFGYSSAFIPWGSGFRSGDGWGRLLGRCGIFIVALG